MNTTTDLIGAVELTGSAAIVITALASAFGATAAARIRIAASLSAWFALVVALAATRALHYENGIGAPGLAIAILLPVAIIWTIVARVRTLHDALGRAPLWLLVGVHSVRLLGISFVLLYAANRLPAPFAPAAGWGDIFVGATAPAVAWFVYRQAGRARPILWIWNIIGLVDLVAAITLGAISSPGPIRLIFAEPDSGIMTTLPWLLIPGFLVPLLILGHIGIFVRLTKTEKTVLQENFGASLASPA